MKKLFKSAILLFFTVAALSCGKKITDPIEPASTKPCLLMKEEATWEAGTNTTTYTYTPEGYLLSSERKFVQQTTMSGAVAVPGYGNNELITNTYDANGFLTKSVNVLTSNTTKPDGTAGQTTNKTTSNYTYTNDKLTKIETTSSGTANQTTVQEFEYDAANNLSKKTNKTLTGTTPSYSVTTVYVYTAGKITETQLINNLTKMNTVSNVTTDAGGRITKESNALSTRTAVYNNDGAVVKSDYNYSGTSSGYVYEYDTQKTFAKGVPSKGLPSEPQWGVASKSNVTKLINSFTAGKLSGSTTVQDTYEYDANGLPKASKRVTTTTATNINLDPSKATTTTTKNESVVFTTQCN